MQQVVPQAHGLLLMGLLLCSQALAQGTTGAAVIGDVTAARNGERIPFASVVVKGTRIGAVADEGGHFELGNAPVGTVTLAASAVGYRTQEQEVQVQRDQVPQITFVLEEDILRLESVVVTGTRSAHYVEDVPVRTEVITAAALETKNASTLYEALEGTPGVRVEPQCQFCDFTMVRMQGLGAEHTQVLIDGQPMYTGLAAVYGLQQIGTVDIDRIEVVKGAGSALYGSGAVAGAINIVTREPSLVPSASVDVQLGSHGTNRYDIQSTLRNHDGDLGLSVYAQRYTADAIDATGPGRTRRQVEEADGVSDRVRSRLTNAGFALYADNVLWGSDRLVLRGKSVFEKREGGTVADDYYRNPLTDGTESITTDRYEVSLTYSNLLSDVADINGNVAYVRHDRTATNDSFLGDYMDTHDGQVPDLRAMRPYLADEHTATANLSYSRRFGPHRAMLGAQLSYDVLEESGMYVVVDEASSFYGQDYRSVADKSAVEVGVYAQDEWTVSDRIMLVPGIRVDRHSSSEEYTASRQVFRTSTFPKTDFTEAAVNPRLALRYTLSNAVTLRASAGTGYRAPYGFSEDLHLCSGSPRVWKSSSLKPETSRSYNVSADYYGRAVRVSANLFRTDLRDMIGFVDADAAVGALGYDYAWQNIDDAFVQGAEISVVAGLAPDLELGIDVTYNQGEYDNVRADWVGTPYESDSKYIPRFPQTTGNVTLEYTPAAWAFALSSSLQGRMYIDYYNKDVDPAVGDQSMIKETETHALVNARVSRRLGPFRIYGGVDNLLGYVQEERHLDDAAFMYAPVYGAMFYAGVTTDLTR